MEKRAYPFKFKTLNYNYEDQKYYTETGMSFADSYSMAAKILEERAKEELVAILNIELFEEDTIFFYQKKYVTYMQKQNFHRLNGLLLVTMRGIKYEIMD